jgi:hypothetical protein
VILPNVEVNEFFPATNKIQYITTIILLIHFAHSVVDLPTFQQHNQNPKFLGFGSVYQRWMQLMPPK